jgi:pyruvate,water dikinase
MAAYERILSGLAGLDEVVDNIRLGDNVVWQLNDMIEADAPMFHSTMDTL